MILSWLVCYGIIYVCCLKNIIDMGATIIGAGILAGASLAGTAATVATNSSNQSYGAGESAAAREWSTNERLAAQQYNTSERLAAQEYNTSERLATQEYNSLPNQVMQARAAGLNPQVLGHSVSFQGASPQSSQGATSSQPSAGLSGIGTSQVPNIPQLISSGADLVNALAKHKETEASLPLINEQVKNYMLQNFGQETTNGILDLEKQLKEATLPVEIKKKFEELAKLGFDKLVSEQQGKKFEQETKLLRQQEDINEIMKGLKGQELIQAQYLTQRWNEIQDSVIALNKAKAGEAKASAIEHYAAADSHQAQVRDLNASAEGKELLNNISRATNLTDIDNAIFNSDVLEMFRQSNSKEELWQQLERNIKNSSGYKNSENRKRVDASLENLRRILGINVSIGASASN